MRLLVLFLINIREICSYSRNYFTHLSIYGRMPFLFNFKWSRGTQVASRSIFLLKCLHRVHFKGFVFYFDFGFMFLATAVWCNPFTKSLKKCQWTEHEQSSFLFQTSNFTWIVHYFWNNQYLNDRLAWVWQKCCFPGFG